MNAMMRLIPAVYLPFATTRQEALTALAILDLLVME